MDNKQAIKLMKSIRNVYSWSVNCEKALDKAIASLEAWDKFSDEIEEILDKRYCEVEGKVQDNLAEGFMQCEKLVKRRIREIEKEIEE